MDGEAGWLVVLDNAESPARLKPWLPTDTKGHLLITSRNPNWRGLAKVHDIDVWPLPVAADFLMERSGDMDRAGAEKLAAALGGLPLACEQAAAYVRETGSSLARFADKLARQPVKAFDWLPEDAAYRRTLPATVALAVKAAAAESPLAVDILRALAWLAPDNISRWLLDGWPAEEDDVDKALAVLLRRALLRKSENGFAIHRLTQQIVRDTDPQRLDSAAAAIRLLNSALTGNPQYDVQLWPRYIALLPHGGGGALSTILPNPPPELELASEIHSQLGLFLDTAKGDYFSAKSWYEKALALTEVRVGPDHPDLAIDLSNLGDLLRLMGRALEAKPLFQRALEIDERALGPEHLDVASDLGGLGVVNEKLGEFEEARNCHERCLTIREAALGMNHPLVATALNNLAPVLEKLGEYSTARAHFERALAISLNHPARGPDHPETGRRHHNLGCHLFEQGDAAAAQPHLLRALEIREKHLDPGHPDIADTRGWLARVRAALDRQNGGAA